MQTIKLSNRDAYEVLTLVENTINRVENQERNASQTVFYKRLKSIEKSLHESCPELVERWNQLQELMRTVCGERNSRGVLINPDTKGIERFTKACVEFDKWLDQNE